MQLQSVSDSKSDDRVSDLQRELDDRKSEVDKLTAQVTIMEPHYPLSVCPINQVNLKTFDNSNAIYLPPSFEEDGIGLFDPAVL